MVIFDPPCTELTSLNQSPKFVTGDYVGDPYYYAKFHRRNLRGVQGGMRTPHFLESRVPYPHFLGVWDKK